MSNSYFQFKQFTILQDKCAMKVSTDACIQGAWTPIFPPVKTVLDIGAGTGLLSLMLAQRSSDAKIDAVEIGASCAQQAKENIEASPWQDQVSVTETDVRSYIKDEKYDLIICNPPFFVRSLLGEQKERNIARHTLELSFEELFDVIRKNLDPGGYASVMLPLAEYALWERLLVQNKWRIFHQLRIIPRMGQKPNRIVSLCSADLSGSEIIQHLTIRDHADKYTPEFTRLMSPYYLKL